MSPPPPTSALQTSTSGSPTASPSSRQFDEQPVARSAPIDEDLVMDAAAGDDDAFEQIAERLGGMVGHFARQSIPGLDADDRRQEALLGLTIAIRTWAERGRAQGFVFDAWCWGVIEKQMRQAFRAATRRKALVLIRALSAHQSIGGNDGGAFYLDNFASRYPDPARAAEQREQIELAAARLFDCSPPVARAAAPLLVMGMSQAEATEFLRSRDYQSHTGPLGEQAVKSSLHTATRSRITGDRRKKRIRARHPDGNTETFSSLREAADAHGLAASTISAAANHGGKAGGCRWAYVNLQK